MKLEPCTGCGRMILTQPIANLTVKCDPTPLNGQQAVDYLLQGGRTLWMVDAQRLRRARPGEPGPVREHRCPVNAQEALYRPRSTRPGPSPQLTPQRPSAGQQTPSSGPSAAPSSAKPAGSRVSDPLAHGHLDCSTCGQPINLRDIETYALIELGATVIDAFHVGGCPTR